ncbi:GlxA family transcriptional regulator [Rhodococcus sp. NPDC003318]|uniref:GlxA family transcriptional regulator n=1 Tax=Rhodococcus sp. NPDC003318 TaxID=3364503 RepID=UPI00369166F1
MLSRVAALVVDRVAMFEFGTVCEVFGLDRTDSGVPAFDFRVCGPRAGVPLTTNIPGVTLTPDHGLDAVAGADLVIVPASTIRAEYPHEVVRAVRDAADAGAIVLTVCSGAFLAGAAGLLDGRRCTTHWMHAAELARTHPATTVDPDVLFVDEGTLITSAGTAAGIDACLHLIRRELGTEVANTIARRMVVAPQRDGGQRQFIENPVVACSNNGIADILSWLGENLDGAHTVDSLAARAAMSSRTFARRFAAETGTTPVKWLTAQRVLLAQHLLEQTDLGLEEIARRCGFSSGALLRHHFHRRLGVAPADYRRRFGDASTRVGTV